LSGRGRPITAADPLLLLTDYLAFHALTRPDKTALQDGERILTYSQLYEQSCRFAALLEEKELRGARIAYVGKNSDIFFPVLFGAFMAGVVLTPINWRFTAGEISHILHDSGATLAICDAEFVPTVKAAGAALSGLEILTARSRVGGLNCLSDLLENRPGGAAPRIACDRDAIALQLYTSGTTGKPKGVMMSHYALGVARTSEFLSGDWDDLSDEEVFLSAMPNFHIGGLTWVLMSLVRGCACHLTNDVTPSNLLAMCEERAITRVFMVPVVIRAFVDELKASSKKLSALRGIYYGAAPIGRTLLDDALRVLDGCRFGQFFGMTETCSTVVFLSPADHGNPVGDRLNSVGRPMPGVDIEIRDPAGRTLTSGEPGEIYIKTATAMSGYWKMPEATKEALSDGWYRTGDGGYLDADGFLHLTDRIKDMIISGGENIYPAEVEDALRRHPAVQDAAVVGVRDETWGERVAACVQLRSGATAEADELIATVRAHIARYKAPKQIVFVNALPRTASGKIQRAVVRSQMASKLAPQV